MNDTKNSFESILKQNRRIFLKNLCLGAGGIMFAPSLNSCSKEYTSELYNSFLNPSAEAKPFFRWWWNGNRLTKDEISRELELMHEAGIGGVEINPIAMPEHAENLYGEECSWLSEEWIEYLQFAIEKANSLGMVTDLIVGTGWPFGGEFLKPEETIQGLRIENYSFTGPTTKTVKLPKGEDSTQFKIKNIVLFPSNVDNLDDGMHIPFDEEDETVKVRIPQGKHSLHIITWQNNFREVMHGAPGGAGPVLDHFNRGAVEKYLNHMSDKIKEQTGNDHMEGIRAMFCDSIELSGANWTHGFEEIFESRRGYDISPYIPLLLDNSIEINSTFKDELKRARYDYSLTLAELLMENFIIPFHRWCEKNNTLSRYQAYGHPWLYTDLIDGYMVPDIPEGDQWLFNGSWQPFADIDQIRYAIWNKYASSAGHLANRKIISTEAMTNTSGVFKASLKYIKQATDVNIATGINHQVLHGFNYSPPEAGFPGWIRYGCYFNENNPWWQYMTNWSSYSSRLSQLFQETSPMSQVAIMGPTLDIWSEYGLDRNPFNLEPWYLHALWQALNHLGFGSDYINGKLLKSAELEGGKILIGAMRYELLLLCEVETMDVDVARKVEELCEQGARIVLIGKQPTRSPNMIGALKNDGIVKKSIENALNSGLLLAPSPETNIHKRPESLMNWTDQLMKNSGLFPLVEFSNPGPQLFHILHRHESTWVLFITNVSRDKKYESELAFLENTQYATWWNAETGEKRRLKLNGNGRIDVALNPLESMIIVVDPLETLSANNRNKPVSTNEFEISGPWQITFQDIQNQVKTMVIEKLNLIQNMDGFEHFAGEIGYKTNFSSKKRNYTTLTIDEVYETAEVILNGDNIGVSWWGNNAFDIKGKIRKGQNTLEIKVTTLLANYASWLENSKTAQFWTSRYKDKSPVKCGLAGKVTLR